MNNYKIKHTQKEIFTIYDLSENRDTQDKLMSILAYYKKYSFNGKLRYTKNRLYKMYSRTHTITRSYFYKLMDKIQCTFFTVEDKIEDKTKPTQSIDITSLQGDFKKHNNYNDNIYNTNTNIVDVLKNLYKGIKGTKIASKKELVELAKALFVAKNIKNSQLQATVFSKIYHSKQKINLVGATSYLNAIINDKVNEFSTSNYNTYAKNIANLESQLLGY